MPTVRKRRSRHAVEVDPEMLRMHQQFGDCLLAGAGRGCGCGLIGPDGTLHPALLAAMREAGQSDDEEVAT
jgi:hypothetical protein